MKQLVYLNLSKNTPEQIGEECRKHGHLITIVRDPYLNAVRKYYSLGSDKRPMEITYAGTRIVSARRVPEVVLKTLPKITPPEFGNF